MEDLQHSIDAVAAQRGFSGVVRVDDAGGTRLCTAYGLADRAHGVPNTVDTRFAMASGSKGMTALSVVSLFESGHLTPGTTARSVLGGDLPLIDDAVTVEHLLAHRSGIGDYLDEEAGGAITDYPLTLPVHLLDHPEAFLPELDGHPAKFAPDQRFSYCNGGYVVLALIAQRAGGVPFTELVHERVCTPAGMTDSAFLRSDELPGSAATHYLGPGSDRTNVLHLPVVGSGDGGMYTTIADLHAFWRALFAGEIVDPAWVTRMVHPRSDVPEENQRYGLGFWLHASTTAVMLEGYDAGVSMRTVSDPASGLVASVLSNTSDGAWPLIRHLETVLSG